MGNRMIDTGYNALVELSQLEAGNAFQDDYGQTYIKTHLNKIDENCRALRLNDNGRCMFTPETLVEPVDLEIYVKRKISE